MFYQHMYKISKEAAAKLAEEKQRLKEFLNGKEVKYGLVGKRWPELGVYAKPMKGRHFSGFMKDVEMARRCFAAEKKNGHCVVIQLSFDSERDRKVVRVFTANSKQDMPIYAELIDPSFIDEEFFRWGVEIIAEATASVRCAVGDGGEEVDTDVGYEGIIPAMNKCRGPPRDPRITLRLHAFRLHRIGPVDGINIAMVKSQWWIIDVILKGQTNAALVPVFAIDAPPGGESVIYSRDRSFERTFPTKSLHGVLCGMAEERRAEGYVLFLNSCDIRDRMHGEGGSKPYLTEERQQQRLRTMVKCKPKVSFVAEVEHPELYKTEGGVTRVFCNDEDGRTYQCGSAQPYISAALRHSKVRRSVVQVGVSWISRNGMVSGVHLIREIDILPRGHRVSRIAEVIEKTPHIKACHAALNALGNLGKYVPPPRTYRVSGEAQPEEPRSRLYKKRVFTAYMGPIQSAIIRKTILEHGGIHITSEREQVKAGDMVVCNNEDYAKFVDTGAEVVLVGEFSDFVMPPPPPVDEPVPSPPAKEPAPFADRDFSDSEPEPEVVVAPRAPSPAGSAGDWRDWDLSLYPKGQPIDMTTRTSAKDSTPQQVSRDSLEDTRTPVGSPGPCTQDMGGNSLDDTRTPVGSPGPCTQDPNNNSEISSMYY